MSATSLSWTRWTTCKILEESVGVLVYAPPHLELHEVLCLCGGRVDVLAGHLVEPGVTARRLGCRPRRTPAKAARRRRGRRR